eukprot:g1392.t1
MGGNGSKESQSNKLRGKVEDWVEVLDNEIDQDDMQIVCLEFLSKLMKRGGNKAAEYLAMANGVSRIADSMKTWPSQEIVLRAACELLCLCLTNEACAEQARIAGMREILMNVLERHQMDAYIPVEGATALRLLYKTGTMVGLKSIVESLETADYVRVVKVIREHELKNKVQEEGFAALARIFEADPTKLQHLAEDVDKDASIVINSLTNFPREERVIIFTCQAITQMGKNPMYLALMGKGGVPALLLDAIKEFSGWNERIYQKELEEELKRKQIEKMNAKSGGKRKKNRGKYAAAKEHKAVKKRLFTKNLPLCQHVIYSISVLLNNKKAEWYFLEQKYLRVLTYLIDQFYQAGEPFIMPITVKRRYHSHQLREQERKRLAKMGIELEKTADEAEAWKERVARRRKEFKPCLFAQTLGRGQCRTHCIECYAIEGVCDKHRANPAEGKSHDELLQGKLPIVG